MYYFELFELPLSLKIDEKKIIDKYYILSKKYHPDRYVMSTDEEKDLALKMTADINKAKDVLLNIQSRLSYILQEKKVITADEKYALPNDFLMEMMELNEMYMEASGDEEKQQMIIKNINQTEEALFEPVKTYFEIEDWSDGEPDLELLKVYYYKKKYLDRLKNQIEEK